MDRGTIVGFRAENLVPIKAEQGLFTSVRSAMGEGYRLVSTSPGITPEERGEITRWSPSHGSLCRDEHCAEGIASYRLQTGRQCVAHSRYAGTEHTARGGMRVLTHIIVISGQDFIRLGCNPLRVWAAIPQMIEPPVDDELPPRLPALHLEPDPQQVLSGGGLVGLDVNLLCGVSSEIMSGQKLVVCGAKRPFAALEWALMLLPASMRVKVSLSAGLRISPSRPVHIAWVDPDNGEMERALAGQNADFLDLRNPPASVDPSPREWFLLLRRWWIERRWDEICLLTNSITNTVSSADLTRFSTICQAIDDAAVADTQRLAQYHTTWQRLRGGSDVERELIDKLGQVIEVRRHALDRESLKAQTQAQESGRVPRAAKVCQ